ncbi:RHS repeat-associated core domain-containing protein [Pseudomonas syringae]
MSASSATATQSFTYAADGRLNTGDAADQAKSIWAYYPEKGGNSPDLIRLLDDKWKAENWGKTSTTGSLRLSAPAISASMKRQVMAEFQYQTFGERRNEEIQPLSLILYGYVPSGGNSGTLKVDTVVVLKGVTVTNLNEVIKDPDTAWTLGLAKGRDFAEVHCQTTAETSTDTQTKTIVTERRYWGTEKLQLVTTQTATPTVKAGVTNVVMQSRTSDVEKDDIWLSSELRSLYSGRVLRQTHSKKQTRFEYDALGRVTRETTWPNNSAQNDLDKRTDKAFVDLEMRYEDRQGGSCVTGIDRAQQGGKYRRAYFDGLQQLVRTEQQRMAGNDLSAGNFCPIQNDRLTLDYLPGGLQRQIDLATEPKQLRDWFWTGSKESDEKPTTGVVSHSLIETTVGDASGPRLIRKQGQKNLKNGTVVQTESAQLPGPATASQPANFSSEKTFDTLGRVIELNTTAAGATQNFKVAYDDLDRPIMWTAPDGTTVKRSYGGMGTVATRLSVTGPGKDDKEIVIGKQTLEAQTRVASREVGKRAYAFTYKNGEISNVELPDKTQLFSERSTDGNTLSWKATTTSASTSTNTTLATFTYDPLKVAVTAALQETGSGGTSTSTLTSTESKWMIGEQRQVSSEQVLNSTFYHSLLGAEYISQFPSESQVIVWRDRLDRRTRVRRDHLDYYYLYNAFGQCERVTLRDLQTGHLLSVEHEFDGFGQETCRRYWVNGKEVERYEQQWTPSGQLSGKVVTREGKVCLKETFAYDTRDRLESWVVDEATTEGPVDVTSKSIRSQKYGYDVINNLVTYKTVYGDKSEREQQYSYSTDNPTQRIKVVSIDTPPPNEKGVTGAPTRTEAALTYDANGNLIQDDQGRKLSYTATGCLASVTGKDGKLITRYEYDEENRLSLQWDEQAQQNRALIYSGDALCGEIWRNKDGVEIKRLRFDEEAGLAVQQFTPSGQQTVFTFSDPQNGIASEYQPDAVTGLRRFSVCYTPWGESDEAAQQALISGLGYNGARRDALTGNYHLGNGYRTYNPALRAFQKPDSASPFGYGGLNDYAYCSGDPVNLYDPDGHVMISRWGQEQMIRTLDQFITAWTPAQEPVATDEHEGSLMSRIIWAGVAILTAVVAVLLAVPTGGLSLVAAGIFLGATLVSGGLSIASAALQKSDPELSAKLDWAAFGIDLATMILPIRAALMGGVRFMRWGGSTVGRIAQRIGRSFKSWSMRASTKGHTIQPFEGYEVADASLSGAIAQTGKDQGTWLKDGQLWIWRDDKAFRVYRRNGEQTLRLKKSLLRSYEPPVHINGGEWKYHSDVGLKGGSPDDLTTGVKELTNAKKNLLEAELDVANTALRSDNAMFTHIDGPHDVYKLQVVTDRDRVHKFVFTKEHTLRIGSIGEAMSPKAFSHAAIAYRAGLADDAVLSAGYIYHWPSVNRYFIVNHSGHYRPSFSSLTPVETFLRGLGVNITTVKAGGTSLLQGLLKAIG